MKRMIRLFAPPEQAREARPVRTALRTRHARRLRTAAAVACLAVLACGKPKPATPSASGVPPIVEHIPADTPYVLAVLGPLDRGYTDRSIAQFRSLEPAMEIIQQRLSGELAGMSRAVRVMFAAIAELTGKLTRERIEELGLSFDTKLALYGVGLVPVFRAELADTAAFRGFVERTLARAGVEVPVRELGGQRFWDAELPSGEHVIVAVIEGGPGVRGGQLVVTVDTAELGGVTLPLALGLERPARSLAQAGTLDTLQRDYQLIPAGVGYVDLRRLADVALGRATGADGEVASRLGIRSDDPACARELDAAATAAPRMVFGMRTMSADVMEFTAVLELRAELAAALERLQAWAPGMREHNRRNKLAVSAAFEFSAFARLMTATFGRTPSFQCPALAEVGPAIANLTSMLAQLRGSPFGSVTGGTVVVRDLAMMGGFPTSFDVMALIGAGQPGPLLSLISELAEIDTSRVVAGGPPARVALPGMAAMLGTLEVAMNERMIGATMGGGADALAAALAEKPADDAPLVSFYADNAFLDELKAMAGDDEDEYDALRQTDPELAEAMRQISAADKVASSRYVFLKLWGAARGLRLDARAEY